MVEQAAVNRKVEGSSPSLGANFFLKMNEDFAGMDRKELAKVYGFLQRKGFSYGTIKEAVRELADEGI